MIATDLITGWWDDGPAVLCGHRLPDGGLGGSLIGGLIALLLRRRMGRLLVVVGSVIALLIFASLFVAGAKLPPVVYAIPALPLITIVLAAAARDRTLGAQRLSESISDMRVCAYQNWVGMW